MMDDHFADLLAAEVGAVIRDALALRDEKIATLEKQVHLLFDEHAVLALKSATPWRSGELYSAGDVVSWSGSLWRCVSAHVSSGLRDAACWQPVGRTKEQAS